MASLKVAFLTRFYPFKDFHGISQKVYSTEVGTILMPDVVEKFKIARFITKTILRDVKLIVDARH